MGRLVLSLALSLCAFSAVANAGEIAQCRGVNGRYGPQDDIWRDAHFEVVVGKAAAGANVIKCYVVGDEIFKCLDDNCTKLERLDSF